MVQYNVREPRNANTCTVDIINSDGNVQHDLGIRCENGNPNTDVDCGMPHGKNDWGMAIKVRNCGDKYGVYVFEHNHGGNWRTETNIGQNHNVVQDGTWALHHLYGRTSRIVIAGTELDNNNKMVGIQNAHYLGHADIKDGVTRMWHHGYEISQNQWVEQSDLCPGDGARLPLEMGQEWLGWKDMRNHKYACVYDKSETKLQQIYNGAKGTNREEMYHDLVDRLCSKKENIAFQLPHRAGTYCAHHTKGKDMAVQFCKEKDSGGRYNFTEQGKVCSASGLSALAAGGSNTYKGLLKWYCGQGAHIKEARCDALSNTDYNSVAETYCKTAAGRADPFCTCYNVVNGVCDRHGSAAGCAKKKQTFDKLVAATPADQRNVWSGMESCFGRVCTGAGKYIPPNTNQNCNKSVNVCIQDIDIGSMTDSNIQAKCDIKTNDGPASPPSVSTPPAGSPPPPPSAQQEEAQSEVEAAEAAVAAGEPGAEERLRKAKEKLTDAEEQGIDAYIPKSLEDLKTNRKKQFATFGGVGGIMMCCCFLLLLVVIASKGGGGRRSVRR